MEEKNVVINTVEEVAKVSKKGKIGKRVAIIGGAVIGLIAGGLWLAKKNTSDDNFEDDIDDFEEEENDEEESTEDSEE